MEIDFEGNAQTTNSSATDNGANGNPAAQPDVTNLNGADVVDVNANNTTTTTTDTADATATDTNSDNSSKGDLEAGTQIEFEGTTYTVAENGDLVDDKGTVFKPAAEVKEWMDSLEEEVEDALSLAAIQESLGVEVRDESGNLIEFTNDAEGVKAYVNSVINLKSNDIQQGAINKLYADNPMLKEFVDYVSLTGSPRGFGELPDRTGIEVIKDNEIQQENIIRMAAQEFGNASLNDNYIKYLKDTGGLYDEAVNQLKALQQKDMAVRKDIAERAEAARQQELAEVTEYWQNVNNVINSRTIAGYKLPESFVKEVNGQKQTFTPNDFYNYLSRQTEVSADGNKITAYQKDLENESQSDLLNRELLSAWLMFTGGTYADLVNMAVKEEQVRVLKLAAKNRSAKKTVKVVKPQTDKVDNNDILLG